MLIRDMKKADLDQVVKLEEESFAVPWSKTILLTTMENHLYYFNILEHDGVIMGYCCMQVIAGEGEIFRIAISKIARGKGFSKQLMECMVLFSKEMGIEALTLEVRASNIIAQNLYKTYGFVSEAVRRGYYSDPKEDAILMWKRDI